MGVWRTGKCDWSCDAVKTYCFSIPVLCGPSAGNAIQNSLLVGRLVIEYVVGSMLVCDFDHSQ